MSHLLDSVEGADCDVSRLQGSTRVVQNHIEPYLQVSFRAGSSTCLNGHAGMAMAICRQEDRPSL